MGFAVDEFPFTSEYDSDLRAVLKYVREIKNKIEGYDVIIAELKDALENIQGMDERITALEIATSDLNDIRTHLSHIDLEISGIINQHNIDIDRLQRQIDNIKSSVDAFDSDIEAARAYSLYLYNKVKYEIETEFGESFMDIYATIKAVQKEIKEIKIRLDMIDTSVINPWHSELGRIDQDRNVKLTYYDLADGGLTAEQYCKLGLTANEYATHELRAIEYARFGKEKLRYHWVFSPTFGCRQDVSVVLTGIVNLLKGTMTASEYAALGLTAEEYQNLGLTALAYLEYHS